MKHYSIISTLGVRKIYLCFLLGCLFPLVACHQDIDIPGGDVQQYSRIYMPQAVLNPNHVQLTMADSIQQVVYGASFGGYGYPSVDTQVVFEVNESLVDSFNQKNGTGYAILPLSSYTFKQSSALIPAGKLATSPLKIEINPKNNLELFKEYLLPVSLKRVENFRINKDLKTAFFVVQAILDFDDFPPYDRSVWSVWGVSSEEPHEGPVNGGVGMSVIDGNLNSFWHSQWVGGFGSAPHWIAYDLGSVLPIHGLSFYGRQSDQNGKPKEVLISASNDGHNWVDLDRFQLANVNNEQRFFVKNMQNARYLKITVLSTYGDEQYTHLAEVYLF